MQIVVNGKEKIFPSILNLQELISQTIKDKRKVIAEVNGDIIQTPFWAQTQLKNGDCVELVNLVGGG